MKLRQKLAMVLASAMIVTAVPVTTMAASTNSLEKTMSIVAGQEITTDAGLTVVVDYSDTMNKADVFYLTATDFEFTEDAYGENGFVITGIDKDGKTVADAGTVKWNSKTELEVTVNAGKNLSKVNIEIGGKAKKGTPAITVDAAGSYATTSTIVLAGEVTTDKSLVATAGDTKNIAVEGFGTLGTIKIEEKVADAASEQVIKVTLPNSSDLVFAPSNETKDTDGNYPVTLKGSRGLSSLATQPTNVDVKDEKEIWITLPAAATKRVGTVAIDGIKVEPESRKNDVSTGDVVVTVKADKVLDATKLTVAKVTDYEVTMEVAEVKDLTAGHGKETVKITVKETTEGSLDRPMYLTIDGGVFGAILNAGDEDSNNGFTFVKDKKNKDTQEIVLDPSVENKTEYVLYVEVSAKASNTGDVVVTATGRSIEEDLELTVAKAEAPFTVETEVFNLETGVKGQKGGKIVITEAKGDKISKGQFRITSDDLAADITDAKVKVTGGDLKIESEVKKGEIIIDVIRTSDEASEITITDIELTTSKAVAEGKYDFLIGGTAVAEANKINDNVADTDPAYNDDNYKDKIKLEGFVTTEKAAKTVEIAEGPEVYLNEDNRMMAKLRVVSEAFGVEPTFNHNADGVGVITFFTADRGIIQFVNGTNTMSINGVAVPMDTATVIKEDGYTYVPARYLAEALGLTVEWNAETRVATFATK